MSKVYRLEERLAKLLKTGGMKDPAFIYGQVRALLDMVTQLRRDLADAYGNNSEREVSALKATTHLQAEIVRLRTMLAAEHKRHT